MRAAAPCRQFTLFWATQTFSDLGSAFTLVALPLLVLHATGSVARMGLLTGVSAVGTIGSAAVAGVVVDRVDRRILMIVCDAAQCVLLGAAATVGARMAVLCAVMAVASGCGMVFHTAAVASVPVLVGRDRLAEANSRLQTTSALAFALGPALAGLVAARFGPRIAIWCDAVSFGVEAVAFGFLRLDPAKLHADKQAAPPTISLSAPANPHVDKQAAGQPTLAAEPSARAEPGEQPPRRTGLLTLLRADFTEGLAFLWRTPTLRWFMLLLTPITFLTFGLTDVFIYYVRHGLHLGDRAVGLVLGAASLGDIAGGLLAAVLIRRVGFGRVFLGAYVVAGVAIAAAGASVRVATVAICAAVFSAAVSTGGIASLSTRQRVTPDRLLGRVSSAFWTVHMALGPIGAVVLTSAVGALGLSAPLLAVGAGLLIVSAAGTPAPRVSSAVESGR